MIVHNAPNFNFFEVIGGLLAIGIVWVTRPRVGTWPKAAILARDKFPTLYAVADQVTEALKITPIDGIVIDETTNASFSKRGWARRSLLTIGLPLWEILDDQERVGLIAHELAHHYNEDVTHSWVIGSAINALSQWYTLLLPTQMIRSVIIGNNRQSRYVRIHFSRQTASGEMLAQYVMYALAQLPLLSIFVLRYLFMRNAKYAEYLADRVAATVAGTGAIVGVLRRLQMTAVLAFMLSRIKTTGRGEADVLAAFRDRVRNVTLDDLNRISQQDRQMTENMMTHPPHSFRLEALHAYAVPEARILLSTEQSTCLNAELLPFRSKIQSKLLEKV